MRRKSIIIRSSPEFKKMLDDIKLTKIRIGNTDKMLSDRRLTLALSRMPELREKLIESKFKNEK